VTAGAGAPRGATRARNGAAAVVDTMVAHGVDTVFGIPGTSNLELYRHLQRAGLRHVTPRHEQGAGYAADGYARVSGRPAAVLTTSGPGLTNAMTAAATSYADSVPALYVSPGVPLGTQGRDLGLLHENKDSSGAMGRLVRWSRRARSPDDAADAVADAMTALTRGRARPVHVEIPVDVLEAPWDGEPPRPEPRAAPSLPEPAAVEAAASLLARAGTVLVIIGGGGIDAVEELQALAERLDAPVVTTSAAKGVLPERSAMAAGASIRLPAAQQAAAAADVLLVVGSELGDSDLWGGTVRARSAVRVDVEAGQLTKNLSVDGSLIVLCGDAAAVLQALLEAMPPTSTLIPPVTGPTPGQRRAADLRRACAIQARADAGPNAELAVAVAAGLPDDAVVTGDSSQITYFGAMHFLPMRRPRRFCYMTGYATLGYALPAAVGATVALPGTPAVALAGDGALMFSVQELMTAVELGSSVVTVVVDNGGYREIRDGMVERGIPPLGVDLARPDFVALARAFGARAHRVDDPADLSDRLSGELHEGGPAVLVVDLT